MARTILIVDDSATQRAILKAYLGKLGCTLVDAGGAEAGLAVLAAQPVQVVISDVWLEGTSGLELAQAVRAQLGPSRVGIILISGEAAPELRDKALAAGADEFIKKPLNAEALKALVTTLLARAEASG